MSAHIQKVLTFMLGVEEYGIPVQNVREIIGVLDITCVPKMPDFIKGVINLRGKIIPVMDLRVRLGMPIKDYNERTCIIIVEINSKDAKRFMGIVVDTISEVLNIQEDEIEQPPQYGKSMDAGYLAGIGKVKDRMIILLDILHVLNIQEICQIRNA